MLTASPRPCPHRPTPARTRHRHAGPGTPPRPLCWPKLRQGKRGEGVLAGSLFPLHWQSPAHTGPLPLLKAQALSGWFQFLHVFVPSLTLCWQDWCVKGPPLSPFPGPAAFPAGPSLASSVPSSASQRPPMSGAGSLSLSPLVMGLVDSAHLARCRARCYK